MKRYFIVFCSALALVWAQVAFAAANVTPTGPSKVTVGQTFTVAIVVSGAKDVDTIRVNGSFTQDLFDYKSASPAGVFQNVSPGTYVDQAKGIFSFGAFTLSSKANGSARIAVLTFRAKKAGSGYVQLTTSSRILSAGEDQMGSVGRLNITVEEAKQVQPEQPQPIPPVIPQGQAVISLFSTTQPDPNVWYPSRTVLAGWKIEGKTPKSVFVGFDQAPDGPAELKPTDSLAKFEATNDGVWYIHLIATFADKTIQRADLRVQIDTQAPHPITPVVDQTGVKTDVPNFLRFGTTDDISGIARYEVYLDGTLVTSTLLMSYPVSGLPEGLHTALVKAYDFASNEVEGSTAFTVLPKAMQAPAPTSTTGYGMVWVMLFSLLAILVLIFALIWDRKRKKEHHPQRFHR